MYNMQAMGGSPGWGSSWEQACLFWSTDTHSLGLGYLEEHFILSFYYNSFILRECTWELWAPWKAVPLRSFKKFPLASWGLAKTVKTFFLEQSPPLSAGHLTLHWNFANPFLPINFSLSIILFYSSSNALLSQISLLLKCNIDFALRGWNPLLFFPNFIEERLANEICI